MTDEEKKRVLQMIFSQIGADHTVDGLKIEFKPRAVWEPYLEAVLARQRREQSATTPVTTSERKMGLGRASYNRLATLRLEGSMLKRAA